MSEETPSNSGAQRLIAQTMTESELAKALGVPVSLVKRLRYDGEIPYVLVGRGRPIYLVDSVLAWLAGKESTEWRGEHPKNNAG